MKSSSTSESWATLLLDAVNKPGLVSEAYSRFWNYSTGNQLLAMHQCSLRGIEPGPISTFKGWQELGRNVLKGQKAIELCMPISGTKLVKTTDARGLALDEIAPFSRFVFRRNWFVLSQTDGISYVPQDLPDWNEERALATLRVSRVNFSSTRGNALGYAIGRMVSVSPLADFPAKTMFHELAHVVLGHTAKGIDSDTIIRRDIREAEAESVALIVSECLGLPGAEYSRGYIQSWLKGQSIPEVSARRILKAADAILKAGNCVPV